MKTAKNRWRAVMAGRRHDRSRLAVYIDTIDRYPILTDSRIRELLPAAKKGDEQAIESIIGSLLRLVTSVAINRSPLHPQAETTDLMQNGILGIYRAIKKFDMRRDIKFASYAVWWIRAFIDRGFYGQSLFTSINSIPGFDRPSNALSPLDNMVMNEERDRKLELFREGLKQLSPIARRVLTLRLGLTGEPKVTLAKLGKIMGVSHETVRKIEAKAIEKLKALCLEHKN